MRKLLRRLHYAVSQRRRERELSEELAFHRDMKQQEFESQGLPARDAAIAASTDPTVISQLQHARLALAGSRPTSQNGALQMIESGNNEAAIAFLGTCSTWLQRAAEGGANVALPNMLVQQVAASLSN